jgi:hypothetical protein
MQATGNVDLTSVTADITGMFTQVCRDLVLEALNRCYADLGSPLYFLYEKDEDGNLFVLAMSHRRQDKLMVEFQELQDIIAFLLQPSHFQIGDIHLMQTTGLQMGDNSSLAFACLALLYLRILEQKISVQPTLRFDMNATLPYIPLDENVPAHLGTCADIWYVDDTNEIMIKDSDSFNMTKFVSMLKKHNMDLGIESKDSQSFSFLAFQINIDAAGLKWRWKPRDKCRWYPYTKELGNDIFIKIALSQMIMVHDNTQEARGLVEAMQTMMQQWKSKGWPRSVISKATSRYVANRVQASAVQRWRKMMERVWVMCDKSSSMSGFANDMWMSEACRFVFDHKPWSPPGRTLQRR